MGGEEMKRKVDSLEVTSDQVTAELIEIKGANWLTGDYHQSG